MPIFASQLRRLDYSKPEEALRLMANHIKYIQEQLEYTLTNLDSGNVKELDTDETKFTSDTGNVSFSGNSIELKGSGGEVFNAGLNDKGVFQFKLSGKDGTQILYLTSAGELIITKKATLAIDCGEW